MDSSKLGHIPLGKSTDYVSLYTPSLLCGVSRLDTRESLGVPEELPFKGVDIWNAYEVSWLNSQGKPEVAIAEIVVPCSSPKLIESKSLKLYFNSFNQTPFNSWQEVTRTLESDLTLCAQEPVMVTLHQLSQQSQLGLGSLPGTCIDHLDVDVVAYQPDPSNLCVEEGAETKESLYSDLLKSNCPVTGQPDWASVSIQYIGKKIDQAGLLKYIISFREHAGFHEQCVERIFLDIMERCQPEQLTVYARYTRRGGLDINPLRSSGAFDMENIRLPRQ